MIKERQITEQSPKHERLEAIQSWTVPSPKIDSLIIDGKLIKLSSILSRRLEKRPDLEVGTEPESGLQSSSEEKEDEQPISPISKDFPVHFSPSTVPEKTPQEIADITKNIATSSLVRTISQLNHGAELGIYSRSVRRDYPEGVKIGSPFTLSTHSEIVRVLLSDNIRSKTPQEIKENMTLKEDLGMTGTSLSSFEDELEHYGFERPELDLHVHETVREVIGRLSQQPKVVESLSSIVIFPRTKGYYRTQKQFQAMRTTGEEQEGIPTTKSFSRDYFKTLTSREPQGPVRFKQVLGVPVFTCELDADFQGLRPFEQQQIRQETQVYSFVVTRLNRLYPQGETQDFPLIVSRGDSLDKEVLQHARSQLAFAKKIEPEKFTPLLVSDHPLEIEDDLRTKVRNYLLSILVSKAEPVDWYKDEMEGEKPSALTKRLFPNQRELFGGDRKDSPLYMGRWLGGVQETFGRKAKEEIYNKMIKQMEKDVGVISRLVQVNPNVYWQVFVGDFLGNFDDWEAAEQLIQNWESRNSFRDSFGEMPPPPTDIFRQRAPDSKLLERSSRGHAIPKVYRQLPLFYLEIQ